MRLISISTTIAFGFAFQAQAATELQWWHAMTGANNEMIEELTKEFNESQSTYKVVPVFKGTYPETLNAGIAAFRSKQPPAIIQVFDAGSGTMMAAEGAIVPAAEILQKGGFTFDKSQYLPGIVAYYSKPDGTMLSFPYNSSSPILYYNKDAFQKAGLNVDNPPKTWPEVFEAAKKIKTSGAAPCGMTSTWLTWIQTENFAAWNNVPYGTNENGLGGTDVKLQINAPLYVEHFQAIADLAKDGAFRYGGRTSEAKQLFTSGECAILTESSGGLGDIAKSGVKLRHRPTALLRGPRPAEHDPRRSEPLGIRRQVGRGIQGRSGILQLPFPDRDSSQAAPGLGLYAGHDGRLRGNEEVGLLREEPRARNAAPADDGQGADRKLEGRPAGQPAPG